MSKEFKTSLLIEKGAISTVTHPEKDRGIEMVDPACPIESTYNLLSALWPCFP